MNLLDVVPSRAAAEVAMWLRRRGEPAYRERQILPRLWQRPVARWREATDLPIALRDALEDAFPLPRPLEHARQRSSDGTVKFLWEFPGGHTVESVLIPERRRRTLCISSQSGCAYGCVFCATGQMGFQRHLQAWEIAAQVREMVLAPDVDEPSHIVFMGMGEPLHNWEAVDRSLTILNAPLGLGIGARHITVSTVGLIPGLEALAERPEQFRIALSLHAPTTSQRLALMPVERRYPMDMVLTALRAFHKRVTFEYVMIRGFNDADVDATALADLVRPFGALVNLLALHPGGAPGYVPSPPERITAFARKLADSGIRVTVRKSRGLDIAAACGQLRTATQRG
jgi:23S rRNA (adenine2503-C2)-methyltransferase